MSPTLQPNFIAASERTKYRTKHQIVGLVLASLAMTISAGTPASIPLPQQMQVRPGVFTLCPAQPNPGPPAQAMTKILVDGASQETGQYLAALLLKSTGYQFQVRTNGGVSTVKRTILLDAITDHPLNHPLPTAPSISLIGIRARKYH
jgi:hexosaminidase